jgi:hypothetical protein
MSKKIYRLLILLVIAIANVQTVHAQVTILQGGDHPLAQKIRPVTILPGGDHPLAQKIRTGDISLTDIPAFIAYFINIGAILAASVSMLFLVIGGYRYIVGGVMQSEREQGKNTIMYAIIGLIVSLLSWAIVNTVQLLVT